MALPKRVCDSILFQSLAEPPNLPSEVSLGKYIQLLAVVYPRNLNSKVAATQDYALYSL